MENACDFCLNFLKQQTFREKRKNFAIRRALNFSSSFSNTAGFFLYTHLQPIAIFDSGRKTQEKGGLNCITYTFKHSEIQSQV